MKKTLIVFLLCLGVSMTISAQRATPSSRDATKLRLAAYFGSFTSVTTISGGNTANAIYSISGTFTDPSSVYDASNINVGMFFLDGTCNMYKITSITSANALSGLLTIRVAPLGTSATEVAEPEPSLEGFIFDPTPNLLLPQWVYNMSPKLESCLFSHMANILDLKIGSITPSILIKTTSYSLSNYDDTVLFDIAAASTLTLPSASANTAKVFKIGKIDESTNILTISPAIRLTASTSISTLNYPRTFIVQSDGTDWRVINQN
jgi:hypothetical protein